MPSSQGTDASKSSLRSGYLNLCKSLPKDFSSRIDGTVRQMLKRLDLYKETDLVLGYVPIHEEIDTMPILKDAFAAGKRVALPFMDTKTNKMLFYEMESLDAVTRGARGLARPPHPDDTPLDVKDFLGSICLVPGLVFDGEGNRIGYGAGYYDEFLAFYPGHKIGLVRSVQISSNPLPREEHDIPVDVLISEGSIWQCRRIDVVRYRS